MSESPQSECSETLGASVTFWTFLVLGGKAGGVGSRATLGSGLRCWVMDAAVAAAVALSRHPWTPLGGGLLILTTLLVLES